MSNLVQQIQDYTVIGSVGDALQQFAGRNYTNAELVARFGTGIAGTGAGVNGYWNFTDTNIVNDASANAIDLTGVNVADADNTTGIMGTNFGVDLDGATEYMTHTTFWSTPPTAMAVNCWIKMTDGQTGATSSIFIKAGDATGGTVDYASFYVNTTGQIIFAGQQNSIGTDLISSTILPNGVTDWYMATINWDTVNGTRLWVNSILEAQDPTATTLWTGDIQDFIIGADNYPAGAISGWFGGGATAKMANFIAMDYTLTQADVDWLYATPYTTPAVFGNTEFNIRAFEKLAVAASPRQTTFSEVERDTSTIYRAGGVLRTTDYLRLEGGR